MLPACYFHQRTYVAQGLMNGVLNETWTHSCLKFEWFSVDYKLILRWWLQCLPMARETRVQSQVKSYERLKKWYLMPSCLTVSIIRYRSRVKWSNPGKGVVLSPTPCCSSYWKESLWVTLDYGRQLISLYSGHSSLFFSPSVSTLFCFTSNWSMSVLGSILCGIKIYVVSNIAFYFI